MTEVTEDEAVRFSEYLDGEMDESTRARFEAEIAEDERLRDAFEEFRATLDVLGSMGQLPPVDLAEGVRTRIRRRSRGRYFGRRSLYRERIQTQIFLVVALAVLLGAAFLGNSSVFQALFAGDDFVLVEDGSGDPHPPDGSSRGVPEGHPAGVEDPSEGSSRGVPEGGAAAGGHGPGASSGSVREMVHRDFRYTVHTELEEDALRRRLIDQFGDEAVTAEESTVTVAVPRADVPTALERTGDLGVVTREVAESEGARSTLDIVFEARQ